MADPIVIVGMACRYPEADDPEQLWQNILAGRRSFRPLPPERLPLPEYGGSGADQLYARRAAVLDGWAFDRQRFRVPGSAYRAVDLTHWLALEVSAAALVDAGLPDGEGTDRGRVGVVLGNSLTGEFTRAATLRTRWPYVRRTVAAALAGSTLSPAAQAELLAEVERGFKAPFPVPSDETLAGALANTIAGRVCNHFDFQGTGYTVDGACASSLLAVATGAAAVADGQLDVALAGGVDLSLDPFELVGFSRLGALATDEMRVYDRRPTGFLPGEGCGVVVLCRESYARRRGLRPYARLLGWGMSSDGRGGLTRPEVAGQRLALRRAYERAGLDPAAVRLVEGHGTGTGVGDATELRTLLDIRGDAAHRAVLGSVKANIGHTKAAAGVAGLIKATLAVHREVLPPTTGCVEPHELLGDGSTLEVTREARPWPSGVRYASVSAMGFGGINTHAVLGGLSPSVRRRLSHPERRLAGRHPGREVVVCAADRPEELAERLTVMRAAAGTLSRGELTDLAATLALATRGRARARFAAAVTDPDELAAALDHALDRLTAGDRLLFDPVRRVFLAVGEPLRVGLLFSGQAAPCYPDAGVLGDLLDELPPGYADTLPIPPDGYADTAVAQPAIVRASLAGLRWLDTLGVRATQAVGHSLGELSALCWAGALTEHDAYALAVRRGAALAAASTVPAGMASLRADRATVTGLLADGPVVVAADNAEQQVVVSGERADVARVVAEAGRRGIPATWLPVPHAFHSPLMAPAAEPLREAAESIEWQAPHSPVASTVTGDWWSGEDPVPVLVEQLTAPVRFREALARLDADLLVEVGPGHILTNLAGPRAVALDAGARSADGVATATAALFAAGAVDSVEPYFGRRFTRPFELTRPRQFLVNPCETDPPVLADLPPVPTSEPAPPVSVPSVGSTDPLVVVRALVAAAAELDAVAIPDQARLLADLHLTSLRVTQLATEAATELGRTLPAIPLSLATATVEEFAETVAALPTVDRREAAAAGVAPWVRVLAPQLVPRPAPEGPPVLRDWDVVGELTGHPLAGTLRAAFPADPAGVPTRLLALPPGLDRIAVDDIATALRASDADHRPLVVLHHGGIGAAVGRSLAAEAEDVPVLVVEVPADATGVACAAAEAHRPWPGYTEVVFAWGGIRTVPVIRPMEISPRRDAAIPLGPGELCVVTGGAKGIGLECAIGLAAATGARVALLGRTAGDDDEVRAALARVAATGAPASYHRVDLTDPVTVSATLAQLRREYGPVRALLHAAGRNEPGRIADLTAGKLTSTLAPKAAGLEHTLTALDLATLRLVVTFGSVIGRTGLAGETDYAIANEWLARRCAELAVAVPDVRWLNIEWSAWAGTGMGVRLGVLDGLERQGLTPIPVDDGVATLLRLLATPALPASVVVAGRLPATPTLKWDDDAEESTARFVENRLARTPRVELVVGATTSLGTDPYLVDHRIDGVPVLPAVFGLEAMAQVCVALGGKPVPAAFSEVALTRPVTVPEREHRELRVAALAREDGRIDVVTRSAETGFAADHFRATYAGPADPPPPYPADHPTGLLPADRLYGPVFFHGPRFQRVQGYHALTAYRCVAAITAVPDANWFGGFHDQHLVLGDPGARDAFLHALQACVPDRRVLPVGAELVAVHARPDGRLTLDARQRHEDGDTYVFDVVVSDAGRSVVEQWRGLTLRAIGPVRLPEWPLDLLGPYLTRTLRRWRPALRVDLAVAPSDQVDTVRTWLGGAASPSTDLPPAADWFRTWLATAASSSTRLDDRVLVASAPAVDWARIAGPPALGPAGRALATGLSHTTGEDPTVTAHRVATCRAVAGTMVALDAVGPAGWLALTTPTGQPVYSTVVPTTAGPVAVSLRAE